MKTSEVLRRVRNHLSDGVIESVAHKRYICYAVPYLYLLGAIGDRDRTRVKRLIRAHLKPSNSLEEWLLANHGIAIDNTTDYRMKLMTTRKAWLTHLIEHYSHKGD